MLRGWERTWREMADAFDRVAVDVVARETGANGTRTWRCAYVKDGDRRGGREEAWDLGQYEWRVVPPAHWVRWGYGAWKAGTMGTVRDPEAGGPTALDRILTIPGR